MCLKLSSEFLERGTVVRIHAGKMILVLDDANLSLISGTSCGHPSQSGVITEERVKSTPGCGYSTHNEDLPKQLLNEINLKFSTEIILMNLQTNLGKITLYNIKISNFYIIFT